MEDFLTIDMDDAVEAAAQEKAKISGGSGHKKDPNMFSPMLGKNGEPYEAKIRILPQGIDGVKNKKHPSISYKIHKYRNDKVRVYKDVMSRETLGEDPRDCQLTQRAWDVYNAGKDANSEELMKVGKSYLPKTRHVVNVYVIDDLVNPENNGKVLKWDQTDNANSIMVAPIPSKTESKEPEDEKKRSLRDSKKVDKFIPHSPVGGRDFVVILDKDPKTGIPTYDGSFYEDEPTNLAPTNEEIMSILNECHDLSVYLDVPEEAELLKQFEEFLALVEAKERTANVAGASSDRSTVGGNDSAPHKVKTESSGSYFGKTEESTGDVNGNDSANEFDMNDSSPVTEEAADSTPISDDDEDDLPF